MAEIPYSTILATQPFRFIVGARKQHFFIHASLVAGQSPILNTLVYGQMKEAAEGCTIWESVSEDTFVRFGQYVYTGDYDSAFPLEPPIEEPIVHQQGEDGKTLDVVEQGEAVENPVPEGESPWDFLACQSKKDKKKKKKAVYAEQDPDPWPVGEHIVVSPPGAKQAWMDFTTRRFYPCSATTSISLPVLNASNTKAEYTEVFLSHAQVYVLASYYLIQPLANLALHKLHWILCNFTLHEERIIDIVILLRFCYNADERPDLRDLVSAYAGCQFKKLWTSLDFRELFATYPKLSVAVMENLVERLD